MQKSMEHVKSFAELRVLVGQEEEIEELRTALDLSLRKIKEQKAQLVKLAAYVTSTSAFYDWLLDREPYRQEEKLSNLRLALMFFADERRS